MAHIFEFSHSDKTPFSETNRLSYDDVLAQKKALATDTAFNALAESLDFPLLVLNDHRQVVFANTVALDSVFEHDHPDHVLGLRFGEFLGRNHKFNGHTCKDPSECANCNELPAILSALKGTYAEAEGVLSLFEEDPDDAVDYTVTCHPFTYGEQAFALLKLIRK